MLTRRINMYLKGNKLWQHCTPVCRNAFNRAMRGHQYGREECIDAMVWFVEGWKAADLQRLKEGVSQINTEQARSEEVPAIDWGQIAAAGMQNLGTLL